MTNKEAVTEFKQSLVKSLEKLLKETNRECEALDDSITELVKDTDEQSIDAVIQARDEGRGRVQAFEALIKILGET